MNKAFVSKDAEDSDEDDRDTPLPPELKGKNYITPGGLKVLQEEYKHLKFTERPEVTRTVSWAAENGDRSENADYQYGKRRLRQIDGRLRFLMKRIEAAEVIDPTKIQSDRVMFGATVTFRNEDDVEKTYSIVGIDEIDISKGKISWISPIAGALMKSKEGDIVQFNSPKGLQEIEIIKIVYREIH